MALNFLKKQAAYVIGHDYGMFPHNNIRFEIEKEDDPDNWGFFANKSNRTLIHIRFDSEKLANPE